LKLSIIGKNFTGSRDLYRPNAAIEPTDLRLEVERKGFEQHREVSPLFRRFEVIGKYEESLVTGV